MIVIVLVSIDQTLIASVQKAANFVPGCRLEVVPTTDAAGHWRTARELALIVYHQTSSEQSAGIVRQLEEIAELRKPLSLVIVSDEHRPAQATDFLRRGAADYLTRPLNIRRLSFLIDALTVRSRYLASIAPASAADLCSIGPDGSYLYGPDEAKLIEQVSLIAPSQTTVLLTGETGTGKSRLAKLIHELSPRQKKPFVVVNCGSLSPTLVESELYGHVKGAFTGADREHVGKFAAVADGTLLLDEIDALPLETQAKLLRAVDERVYEPVGSNRQTPVKARLVVATNRCLEAEVQAGRFRSDLYFRFNVVSLHLPPLRERRSLIVPFSDRLVREFSARNACAPPILSPCALAALKAYDWPGNIRQLRNVIERAVTLFPGKRFESSDLQEPIRQCAQQHTRAVKQTSDNHKISTWERSKLNAEINAVVDALARNENNRSRAADELGISRVTLYKKLHKFGLI